MPGPRNIGKAMGRQSTISRLPPDVKSYIEGKLAEGRLKLDELIGDLQGRFPAQAQAGDLPSRSAVHRYGQKLERRLSAIRASTEAAKIIQAQAVDNNDGRLQAQQAADAFPYLMYVAVMDGRTRPSHAALNGKIWRKDDPVWSVIYPPNGFNCRCRTRALTPGQMKREGLSLSAPPEIETREVDAGQDSRTGELFRTEQNGVRVTDAKGKPITMWVDPGFNSSTLAGHPMDKLLTQKAVDAVGDEAGFELVRQDVLSETRLKAWRAFVSNTLDSGITNRSGRTVAQNQTMTAGVLPLDVIKTMAADGKSFSPVMFVEDHLLAGRKSQRHEEAGNALSRDGWLALPKSLTSSTVYFEEASGNLILVFEGDATTAFKAVVSDSGKVDTVFSVSHDSIAAAVKGGKWKPV